MIVPVTSHFHVLTHIKSFNRAYSLNTYWFLAAFSPFSVVVAAFMNKVIASIDGSLCRYSYQPEDGSKEFGGRFLIIVDESPYPLM